MPPVRVCVVIPARDAAGTLPAALDALAAQAGAPPFEVVVVDDRSRDATAALAAAHPVVTRVVTGPGRGPGAARNVGVATSAAGLVAFTDADCVPTPGWLRAATAAVDAGAELVQGRVVPAGPMGPWDRTLQVDGPTGLFETANLLIARSRFDALGGFEPWLAPRRSKELAEDAWLGWRALRAGATSVFAPDAVVAHAVLPGTPRTYVAERLRLRFFPLILRRIPELRGTPLHRRLLPHPDPAGHARRLWARARPWGRRAPLILAVDVVADLVGLAALGWGWATARRAAL